MPKDRVSRDQEDALDDLNVDLEGLGDEEEERQPKPKRKPEEPLRRELEEERGRTRQLADLLKASLSSRLKGQEEEEDEDDFEIFEEEPEVEEEEESRGKKATAKTRLSPEKLKSSLAKMTKKAVDAAAENFTRQHQAERDLTFSILHRNQRSRFEETMKKAGMEDVVEEVDEYIKEAKISPDRLLYDGAYDIIAATILGQRVLKEREKSAGFASTGRQVRTSGEYNESRSPESRQEIAEFNSRYGSRLTERTSSVLGGPSASFAEWKRAKDADQRRRQRREEE